jgi:hypothetical protein
MIQKRHIGILTGILTAAISPVYAAIHLPPSSYLPRQTISLQAGHGWQDSIDAFIPFSEDSRHLFFLDGSLAVANVYRGGDIGAGYRQLLSNNKVIYGGYTYLGRYKTSDDNFFSQTTLGLEMLGSEWDARLNAYVPIGAKQQSQNRLSPIGIYFQAHKLHGTQLVNDEGVEPGAEIEVGRLIPGLSDGDSTLRTYVSYYHYGFNNDAEKINGGSVRAEYRYNHYVTLTASESYDKVQGNQLVFGIQLSHGMPKINNTSSVEYRMTEYVTRRRIVTTNDRYSQPFVSPENFYFVNNGTILAGNGTYENPYDTVQPAESDAANDGNPHTNYVYIYTGSTPYNLGGQLNIGKKRIFMGSGADLIYRGINVLAASGTPTLVGGLNLSNNNLLEGFNLDGTATGLGTGILGNNVTNITIRNINISNYTGNTGADGTDGQDGDDGSVGGPAPTDGTSGTNGTAGESAYGIHLTNSSNILIRNVNISNLTGGEAGRGGFGGDGGDGGGNNESNGGNGGNGGIGGKGGSAIGIGIENASGVVLNNINITNLAGGDGRIGGFGGEGGDATDGAEPSNAGGNGGNAGAGGDAGDAIGIQLLGTPSAVINTATISGLTGGLLAGEGNDGGNGGDAGGSAGPTTDGGNGGNGSNGGNGGNTVGIQQNGAFVSATNISVSTLVPSLGNVGGVGGTGGAGTISTTPPGDPGTTGSAGATGSSGTAANTTP